MFALLGFLGTVIVIITVVHLYLWKRLVRDTTAPKTTARRVGGLVILVLALLVPATMVGSRAGESWVAWGFLWLALMFYLFVTLLVLEIPMLAARLWLRRRRPASTPTVIELVPERALVTESALVAVSDTATTPEPADAGPGRPPSGLRSGERSDAGDEGRRRLRSPGPRASEASAMNTDRRLLLARGAAIFAGLTAVSITGYGIRTALGPPRLDRVQIPLAKLPRGMDGFRIAVVSDIHLGPLAGRAHAERVVAAVNRVDADVVAVVGDLVDGTVAELGPAAAALRDLRSRRGNYFVTGNHEYYSGVAEWLEELPRLGLRVLQNERLEIDGLDLAGVNDLAAGDMGARGEPAVGPDFDAALGDRDPARPVVLMAHQPVQVHDAARYGVDLQLSGHTHGGQMVPFNLLVQLQQPVTSGLAEIDGTKVYVTNGAGFWGPPVRVGAEPQVSLVELRTA